MFPRRHENIKKLTAMLLSIQNVFLFEDNFDLYITKSEVASFLTPQKGRKTLRGVRKHNDQTVAGWMKVNEKQKKLL